MHVKSIQSNLPYLHHRVEHEAKRRNKNKKLEALLRLRMIRNDKTIPIFARFFSSLTVVVGAMVRSNVHVV